MINLIVTTKEELESCIEGVLKKCLGSQDKSTVPHVDEFLTIDEAAKYLNLAKQSIYGFTSKGQIPFIKRAKRLLFRKSDLEKWLLEGRKKSITEIENDLKMGVIY